tara:strand:+ start:12294 stop:12479 length:186 start_codon:yes stop_codon:yes gene_type:complete
MNEQVYKQKEKWEYGAFIISSDDTIQILNNLGELGWELIEIKPMGYSDPKAFMKRRFVLDD